MLKKNDENDERGEKREENLFVKGERNYKLFSSAQRRTNERKSETMKMEMEVEICERKMKYISDISSKFYGSQVI